MSIKVDLYKAVTFQPLSKPGNVKGVPRRSSVDLHLVFHKNIDLLSSLLGWNLLKLLKDFQGRNLVNHLLDPIILLLNFAEVSEVKSAGTEGTEGSSDKAWSQYG